MRNSLEMTKRRDFSRLFWFGGFDVGFVLRYTVYMLETADAHCASLRYTDFAPCIEIFYGKDFETTLEENPYHLERPVGNEIW